MLCSSDTCVYNLACFCLTFSFFLFSLSVYKKEFAL